MTSLIPFDDIRAAARGHWSSILESLVGEQYLSGRNGPCPGCGGSDRFQFNVRSPAGAFSCRAHPKGGGDGFELIEHALDIGFAEAARMVAGALGMSAATSNRPAHRPPTPAPAPAADWSRARRQATEMWSAGLPISSNDAAGRYLAGRGLALPADSANLRHHPALPYWKPGDGRAELVSNFPALLARISLPDGRGCGLHRIYLTPDGRKLALDGLPAKKLFKAGDLTGAAVQLARPADGVVGICEGIETALAFGMGAGIPVWAGVSAPGLAAAAFPPDVRVVHIGADPDEPGQRAALALAQRLADEGRQAWIHTPPGTGDWNDWLLESRGVAA